MLFYYFFQHKIHGILLLLLFLFTLLSVTTTEKKMLQKPRKWITKATPTFCAPNMMMGEEILPSHLRKPSNLMILKSNDGELV